MSRGKRFILTGSAFGARRRLISFMTIATALLAACVGVALQTASASGAGPRASAAVLGRDCSGRVFSKNVRLTLVRASKWSTDDWAVHPPHEILPGTQGRWESQGGFFRGCHADVLYEYEIHTGPLTKGTVEFSETKHFDGRADQGCHSSPHGGHGQRC